MLDGNALPSAVSVTVAARLHLGFLDLNGTLGRRFGGIGLAVSDLDTRLTIKRVGAMQVSGPHSERVRRYIDLLQQSLRLTGFYDAVIERSVPSHAGLGSGTQLALATASALRRLHDLPPAIEDDALKLSRGARSGIGIGLFRDGGFVVDGGHGERTAVAPIVSRLLFPDHWRVLIVLDPARQGVHGKDETAAFAALAPMSETDAGYICRLVLMNVLPALVEHDIGRFGGAIKALQSRLGDYFAGAQGGWSFASPAVAAVLSALDAAGAHGIGQSSWGPTGFAFAPSRAEADRLATLARQHPASRGLDIKICRGLNRGAEIEAHLHAERGISQTGRRQP